jgi:septum formation protein
VTRFVLASASAGRLATLRAAGIEPEVIASDVDEASITGADTADVVERLAIAKACAVAESLRGPAVVLGCDSLLDLAGVTAGKPADAAAARRQWQAMRGRTGVLCTGHAVIDVSTDQLRSAVVSTTVTFGPVSDAEIEAYVATGEPLGCAGSFTIDGLGGWFVESVIGDHHNVIGLSLPALRRMLLELGYTLADFGYPFVTEPIG